MKTFMKATEDYLKNASKPATVREIYNGIKNEIGNHSGDPYFTLSGVLSQNVKKSTSKFFVVNYDKPRTLWLKERQDELVSLGIEIDDNDYDASSIKETENEKELYPVLINVLFEKSIYAKRIDEKLTEKGKKGLNKWINPDIVGVKYHFEEYSDDVYQLLINSSQPLFELYSYEVKKEISLSNIKECYFQAVSNSSWANYGYLVCKTIDENNDDLMSEIERLVNSFGIGLLKLNICKDSSENDITVLFQARLNNKLDYATIENLYGKNEDFAKYIDKINKSIKIKEFSEF